MTKLTKELIEETLKKCDAYHGAVTSPVSVDVVRAMAHQLLASMEQEPVYLRPFGDDGETFVACDGNDERAIPLYAAPQLPQPAEPVVNLPSEFHSSEGVMVQLEKVMAALAVCGIQYHRKGNACRAAMLQGSEPVSHGDELPMDYQQGHKDGLEWAARLAEANHPQTGDWLYDDPLELAKAIRKGPDMPVEPMQKLTFREALAAIRNLGPIDAEKIQAERDALNEPDVPDGYALVPVEPTEKMIIEGFESVPHPLFQPADWDKYQTMSGCEQAAHRAKLCWAAMIKAAPNP